MSASGMSASSVLPMVLPDTSVWIAHFRIGDPRFQQLLRNKRVVAHPFIISELALGSIADRIQTLADLRALAQAPVADQGEVDRLIEVRQLYAKGIGFVDAHLIASALIHGDLRIWTLDKRLAELAQSIGVAT
jgi:predicted nucleic acid-binding protein